MNWTHGLGFGIGMLLWTLAEYSIHRFVFHGGSKWHAAKQHIQHHRDVDSFATLRERLKAASQVLPAIVLIAGWAIGWTHGLALALGFTTMYLVYNRFHENAHRVAPKTAYGRWCRKVHFSHHFHTPHLNHGVTCPWWDMAFGTYAPESRILVPERQAMEWLVDPETGDVRAEYQEDYALKRKRAPRKKAA